MQTHTHASNCVSVVVVFLLLPVERKFLPKTQVNRENGKQQKWIFKVTNDRNIAAKRGMCTLEIRVKAKYRMNNVMYVLRLVFVYI